MQVMKWTPSNHIMFDTLESTGRSCLVHFITRISPPVTTFSRHLERTQEVPGRPPRPGPPWKLLVSLQVSRKRTYGRLNAGDDKRV
jgi:hypothetical protein